MCSSDLGATALEAAAIGKPVVMHLRREQYEPLYRGDVAPVCSASNPREVAHWVETLVCDATLRRQAGEEMRKWLVRTHGEERTGPLMLALLRLAADSVPLPPDLENPLETPESEAEAEYHASCLEPFR